MDPLRRRTLQNLRRISGASAHSQRRIGRAGYDQRRGVQWSKGSRSITLGEFTPVKTVPLTRAIESEQNREGLIVRHFPSQKRVTRNASRNNTNIEPQGESKTDAAYIKIGTFKPFHPAFLRDACECEKCVDPSSRQKNFQTTDIPKDIKARSVNVSVDVFPEGGVGKDGDVEIVWENDVAGFEPGHKSVFSQEFFKVHSHPTEQAKARFQRNDRKLWNREVITNELEFVNYEEYMNTDEALFRAVRNLHSHGLLLIRGVPESEKSVEEIANRIGNLRDSLYGRTWDVKSVPKAKNVAYTAQFLGLHMDLLYMSDPPGFQFLHCLQNTCNGGSSLFTDAMYAASKLSANSFYRLAKLNLAYHYKNAGEHYYFRHPVIQVPPNFFGQFDKKGNKNHNTNRIDFINYSPPFQANHIYTSDGQQNQFPALLDALREFSGVVESEENLYEYRLQEGECVVFNNRRILHGRRQFDTSAGSRWLKGAYIDTDVFMSKYRVLSEKFVAAPLDVGCQRLVNEAGFQSLEHEEPLKAAET